MPFCHRCGKAADPDDTFCRFCGTPLPDSRPGPGPLSPAIPEASPDTPPLPLSDSPAESPALPKNGPWLSPVKVTVLAGILVIVAVAAYFAFSGSPFPAGTPGNGSIPGGSGALPAAGQCSGYMTLCSGTCVDLKTDSGNCGACGYSVPYGETCINGKYSGSPGGNKSGSFPSPKGTTIPASASTSAIAAARQTSCMSPLVLCSGICRNLQSDSRNCGACGYVCPSGTTCQNSWCLEPAKGSNINASGVTPTGSQCSGGETLCGNVCANLLNDKKNCAVCGRACGNQQICVNGRCGPACTKSGTTLCGDTCVDLHTNMNNCGSCGTECRTFLPNALGSLCTEGKCVVSGCKTDYADCDEKTENGCEINIRLDANNCGSCGNKCPTGQVCLNRQCSAPVST